MKRIITMVCAALVTLGTMNAKILMTESFERAIGTLNVGDYKNMGTNTSDWWWFSGNTDDEKRKNIQVAEGSLSYAGYQSIGVGNKAYLYSSDADDLRKWSTPITSGKVYLAAIIKVDQINSSTSSDYCLSLGDGGANNMSAKLYTKTVKTGSSVTGFKFGVAKSSEDYAYVRVTNQVYEPNTDYLVVLEYEFVDGEKNDTARLYVNPTKATTTPTLVCVQDTATTASIAKGANSRADVSSIASVNMRQGSNTPYVYIDEIKVATTWAELWESSGTPTIEYSGSADFGLVAVNDAETVEITVSGSSLTGDIGVQSNNSEVKVSSFTIAKADAMKQGGFKLTLTLTATAEGSGSANITLKSTGATDVVIPVKWTATAALPSVANIAALKVSAEYNPFMLQTEPVVVGFINSAAILQDASGALPVTDQLGSYAEYSSLKVGDKLKKVYAYMMDAEGNIDIFPAADMAGAPKVVSSGNALEPLAVTASELTKYGPAYVKLTDVEFPSGKFAAGTITVQQNGTSFKVNIADGDLVGQDMPAKADLTGLVGYISVTGVVLKISSQADVADKGGSTGMENVQRDNVQGTKIIEDGVLYIMYNGTKYNVQGEKVVSR